MSFCPAPRAANEIERLMTLLAYDVLDTEPEAPFDELTQLAARICEGQTIAVTASIGIGLFPDHAGEASALIQCADTAMYRTKKAGKNAFIIARATQTK